MNKQSHIQAGAAFRCPYCQSDSIAKENKEYEGFKLKRVFLACALCQAELDVAPVAEADDKAKNKTNKLQALFAQDCTTARPDVGELLDDDGQRHFCKNCLHNFFTAFKCFCNLHQQEVEPLHDCPEFSPKKKITEL
ncbi:MAG: hypothetical protein GX946_08140 [Oligosphaeraceae bacterium]|nr:hypothetical protein [Oligosphaeraceae bacterium]